jgi:eukaryotic-like serine/threonine-protein kinase
MSMILPEPARIGRYQLVTLLAEGGMARVYLAFARGPAGFDKLVVVKQIRPELAWDQDFVTMFFDEARIAARLSHRNVVHTYEVVEENGLYLLVMEYLEGHTLGDALRRVTRENMPIDQHLWILTQVLAGLSYAHELRDYDGTPLGVVHRDVSPSNVFLSYTGEVKLLDFGIAKAAGAISATHEGTIKGKLGYSAPEQFLQSAVDGRADLYAVGVLLWEALGRRRRRMTDTPAATYQARIAGLEPKIREVCPDVPAVLADICDRATAPDPAERYMTAAEFQRDLEEYLDQASRPPGRRDLAALLERHFAAERAERRARVQELLSTAISQNPPASQTVSFASRSPPGAIYDLPVTEAPAEAPVSEAPPPLRSSIQNVPLRRRPWLIAGGLIVVVGAFAAALTRKDNTVTAVEPDSQNLPAAAPSPAPSAAVAAVASEDANKKVEAATIQLFIQVKPVFASLTLDGARLVSNPFQADVRADTRAHVLHVSAAGYQSVEQVITFVNDMRLEIALKPAAGAAAKAARLAEAAERRSAIDNWKPTGGEITRSLPDPSPVEPRSRETEVELKRPPATPPRPIDEKDPYSP